jgi:ferrous iron transport protein A
MRLQDVPLHGFVRLAGVEGGSLQARLTQHGLFPGDLIRVIRSAPLGGPLLVEVNGRRIALSRRVAGMIFVEEAP